MKKKFKMGSVPYKLWHVMRLSLVFLLVAQINIFAAETVDIKQTVQITGTVTDEDGLPMPGANVTVKGTTTGVVTDVNGKYSINVPNRNATVQFSFVGYLTEEVVVGNQSTINMQLRSDAIAIDDVVVIGYGTMRKSDVTGSLASVSSEDIIKRNPTTLAEGLQGMAPGVQVLRSSGAPDGGVQVRIRGTATINNSPDPIWVVDGVIVGTSASWLNPNDVESIEILKDASATAIYGSRGANGVVMVTTKKGQKGRARLNVSANWGIQTISGKIDMANANQFATWANEGATNQGTVPNPLWANPGALQSIDWQDEMSRVAWRQQYNVSASGGADNVQAMLSVGYMKNDGVIIESSSQRINARANVNMQVKNFINVGVGVTYMHSDAYGQQGRQGNLYDIARIIPTMDTFAIGTNVIENVPVQYPDGTWGHFPRDGSNSYTPRSQDNPVAVAYNRDALNFSNRVLTNANVDITILKGLVFHSVMSINYMATGDHSYTPRQYRTYTATTKDNFSLNQRTQLEYRMEDYITYDRIWGKHHPTFMVGWSVSKQTGERVGAQAGQFPSANIRDLGLSQDATTRQLNTSRLDKEDRTQSFFGRLTYSYDSRYSLTATIRRDGSSNFGPDNKYGTFPSFAGAWRVTQESFMQSQNIFSDLKVRVGWGQVGNAGNSTNLYAPQLSSNRVMYYFQDATAGTRVDGPGYAQLRVIDTGLKWETNETTNIGVDMAFLKNSLSISVDWYQRDAKDLLLNRALRPSSGYPSIYTNAGHIRNRGFEFLVAYRKQFGDWSLNASFNGTTVKNEAIDIGDDIYYSDGVSSGAWWSDYSITRNGYPVGSFFGYRTNGLWQNQADVDAQDAAAKALGYSQYFRTNTKAGDRKYEDLNGDGQITALDREIIGDGYPAFTYGLNLTLGWKNWDFNMYLSGVAGQDILSYSYRMLTSIYNPDGSGMNNVLAEYGDKAWRAASPNNEYPRFTTSDPARNGQVSNAYVVKGDFLKVQNLQIGYTFGKELLTPIKMETARVYVGIDNVFTFTSYKYGDPEIGNSDPRQTGFDNGRYPFPRIFTFGVTVGF